MQVPLAHVVGPVHPVPPHCPYNGAPAELLVAAFDDVVVLTFAEVEVDIEAALEVVLDLTLVANVDAGAVELGCVPPQTNGVGPGMWYVLRLW